MHCRVLYFCYVFASLGTLKDLDPNLDSKESISTPLLLLMRLRRVVTICFRHMCKLTYLLTYLLIATATDNSSSRSSSSNC